jgi:hypothetical protein
LLYPAPVHHEEEAVMMRKPLWVTLGLMLLGMIVMVAGPAGASRTEDTDPQAPRVGRFPDDLSGTTAEVQAPRSQDVQTPHGARDVRTPRDDVQAPRSTSD